MSRVGLPWQVLAAVLALLPARGATQSTTRLERLAIEATMMTGELIRDSGSPLTREFVASCMRDTTPTYARLECDDLVTTREVALVQVAGSDPILVLIENGASVERRWAFRVRGDSLLELAFSPLIDLAGSTISALTIAALGDARYTPGYFERSAQSSFRLRLPRGGEAELTLLSTDAEGPSRPIGLLRWDGRRFVLVK